jgi:penicillin amidase
MRKTFRIAGYILLILLLIVGVAIAGAWWVARRALPQVDGSLQVPELGQEVLVERDGFGVPRIRAASLSDLVVAQGYVTAQDRLWQMDLLRRVAAGELSEILGAAALETDREYRRLGLRQAAEREAAEMDPALRGLLESYAAGVNRYISERSGKLPWEFVALRYEPRPWRPVDTLLIGGYMYRVLTYTWPSELLRARIAEKLGAELAQELFVTDSPRDRYLVAPEPAAELTGRTGNQRPATFNVEGILASFADQIEFAAGSNNWVVAGQHTYSGKPLLANDPHLTLTVPAIWYQVHLTAPGWNVKGVALPGVPLVIIGHNETIAWGFTNNGADVQDLFIETFHPEDPRKYRVGEEWTEVELRREVIKVKGQTEEELEVVVTRNGPIVERAGDRGYALKWVATERGGLQLGYSLLGRARTWEEFLAELEMVPGPAQNTVYADVNGNIGFVVAARIPMRRAGNGSVPVPGDTDDYAWTGYIPYDELPVLFNPPEGIIATANARVVGPGYPHHLTDRWMPPYRTERIYDLLRAGRGFRPEDFLMMQADVASPPHRWLASELIRAAAAATPADARLRSVIARLRDWDGMARADGFETTVTEYTRRELARMILAPKLGKELISTGWPRLTVFLENVLRNRPGQWLPEAYTDYDALLLAAANAALNRLDEETRRRTPEDWKWGSFLRLEMLHPLGRSGLLRRLFSFPAIEQQGSGFSIKQTGRTFGPSMRFVADLADWDRSLMVLPAGQSGQVLSRHYRDQFDYWFHGEGLPSAFSDEAQLATRKHTLRLVPAPR